MERGLKRALAEREEALKELATAARWVDSHWFFLVPARREHYNNLVG